MRRHDFITLFGGAAAWPAAVRAQQALTQPIAFSAAVRFEKSADVLQVFAKGSAKPRL